MVEKSVGVARRDDKWIVFVVEDGHISQKEFSMQPHAQSWASGQASRLNVPIKQFPDDESVSG